MATTTTTTRPVAFTAADRESRVGEETGEDEGARVERAAKRHHDVNGTSGRHGSHSTTASDGDLLDADAGAQSASVATISMAASVIANPSIPCFRSDDPARTAASTLFAVPFPAVVSNRSELERPEEMALMNDVIREHDDDKDDDEVGKLTEGDERYDAGEREENDIETGDDENRESIAPKLGRCPAPGPGNYLFATPTSRFLTAECEEGKEEEEEMVEKEKVEEEEKEKVEEKVEGDEVEEEEEKMREMGYGEGKHEYEQVEEREGHERPPGKWDETAGVVENSDHAGAANVIGWAEDAAERVASADKDVEYWSKNRFVSDRSCDETGQGGETRPAVTNMKLYSRGFGEPTMMTTTITTTTFGTAVEDLLVDDDDDDVDSAGVLDQHPVDFGIDDDVLALGDVSELVEEVEECIGEIF